MGSNVAFALRSILRKDLPKDFKVRMDGEEERERVIERLPLCRPLNTLHKFD